MVIVLPWRLGQGAAFGLRENNKIRVHVSDDRPSRPPRSVDAADQSGRRVSRRLRVVEFNKVHCHRNPNYATQKVHCHRNPNLPFDFKRKFVRRRLHCAGFSSGFRRRYKPSSRENPKEINENIPEKL
jgi:hypothetical protein